MVRLLLEHKADHSLADISGLNPLQLACSKGQRHISDLLLKAGADPNMFCSNKDKKTALLIAASGGQDDCVEVLCKGGADLDIKDMWGFTALSKATINQHDGVVKVLLEHGADANVANRSGATPVQYAALWNHCTILRELITHGASMNKFSRDIPPLSAIVLNGCAECTGRLVEAGSDLHCLDKQRKMALYNAIVDAPKVEHLFRDYPLTHSGDRAACARILLDAGAEVGTVWRTQFWEPRHRDPKQVASYKLLLRASSLRRVPPTLAHGLFQKLALLGCTDAMRLMCSVGHVPAEQEILQVTPWEEDDPCQCCLETDDDDSKLCHKMAHSDFIETLRCMRHTPAPLKHMARLRIRSHLHKNVIFHSGKLPLSDDLKKYITVDGRNEYLPLIWWFVSFCGIQLTLRHQPVRGVLNKNVWISIIVFRKLCIPMGHWF